MSLPQSGPALPDSPTKWVNGEGLNLRLQCFLVVRDADRRIACVRFKANPEFWNLPGETILPNEDFNAAAERVSRLWFGEALPTRISDVLTWSGAEDGRWYVLFLYEAQAPKGGLKKPDDTEEIAFVPAGKAPGPWAMSHADVFERLKP